MSITIPAFLSLAVGESKTIIPTCSQEEPDCSGFGYNIPSIIEVSESGNIITIRGLQTGAVNFYVFRRSVPSNMCRIIVTNDNSTTSNNINIQPQIAKYEFSGAGCGSGVVYTVLKDGQPFGNIQPQCPNTYAYLRSQFPGSELWVNGIQIVDSAGVPTIAFIQALPLTGNWGAYLTANNITAPTIADYLAYFNSQPVQSQSSSSNLWFYLGLGILGLALFGGKR